MLNRSSVTRSTFNRNASFEYFYFRFGEFLSFTSLTFKLMLDKIQSNESFSGEKKDPFNVPELFCSHPSIEQSASIRIKSKMD